MSRTRRGRRKTGVDNYPTPEWPTRRFLEVWPDLQEVGPRWLEPCAGDGALIEVADDHRDDIEWTAVEIREDTRLQLLRVGLRPDQIFIEDFFTFAARHAADARQGEKPFDVVIMNPPFRLTMEFVTASLGLAPVVVMFQRMNYCGSDERNDFFADKVPDLYVIPNRVSHTADGKADSIESAWHVWGPHPTVGVGEWRVLRSTPLEERKRCRARIVRARDDTGMALTVLFEDSLSEIRAAAKAARG